MALEKDNNLKDYQEEYLQIFKEKETQQYLNMQQLAIERQNMYINDPKYKNKMNTKFMKFDKTVEQTYNKAILQNSVKNSRIQSDVFIPKTQYGLEQTQQHTNSTQNQVNIQDASLLLQSLENKQEQNQESNKQTTVQDVEQLDNLQNKDIIKQYIHQIQKLNKKYGQQEEFIAKLQKAMYNQNQPLDLQQLYNDVSVIIDKASINGFLYTKIKQEIFEVNQQLNEVRIMVQKMNNMDQTFQTLQNKISNAIQIHQLTKKMNQVNIPIIIYLQGSASTQLAQQRYNYYISNFQCDVIRQNSSQQFYNNFVGFMSEQNSSKFTVIDYTKQASQSLQSLIKLLNLDKIKASCCISSYIQIGEMWLDIFSKQQILNNNQTIVQINNNSELFRLTQILQNKINDLDDYNKLQVQISVMSKLTQINIKSIQYTCIKQVNYTEKDQIIYGDNMQILI